MPVMRILAPLQRISDALQGAKIKAVLLGTVGCENRLVIVTDRVDGDTGEPLCLVVIGVWQLEVMPGVLAGMGGGDDG